MLKDLSETAILQLDDRALVSHKGDFGHILVIGGQQAMAGAPALAGMSALRSGAGKVTILTPDAAAPIVAGFHPCLMVQPIGEHQAKHFTLADFESMQPFFEQADVIAIGPGIGRHKQTIELVCKIYQTLTKPLVVDADALFALATNKEALKHPVGQRVLTPHAGEFMRLTGLSGEGESNERARFASQLCHLDETNQTMVVLKGYETVICDGKRFAINSSGNPGMATGGTGDCLTGVIAALLARPSYESWQLVRLAVYLHGLAGDIAAENYGQEAMVATDLMESLPTAWSICGVVKEANAPRSPLFRKGKSGRRYKHKKP